MSKRAHYDAFLGSQECVVVVPQLYENVLESRERIKKALIIEISDRYGCASIVYHPYVIRPFMFNFRENPHLLIIAYGGGVQ